MHTLVAQLVFKFYRPIELFQSKNHKFSMYNAKKRKFSRITKNEFNYN